MALIHCSECGAQISDEAPTCIKCGAPAGVKASPPPEPAAKEPVKKKTSPIMIIGGGFIALCVGLAIYGTLTGKGNSQNTATTVATTATTTPAANASTPAPTPVAAPQTSDNPDIAAVKPFIHNVVEREEAINTATNQLGQDLQNVGAPNISEQTRTELKADIVTQVSAINSLASEADALTAPNLQNAEADKFAKSVLSLHKQWTQAAQARMSAVLHTKYDDADKIKVIGESVAEKEGASLLQLSLELKVPLADLAQ